MLHVAENFIEKKYHSTVICRGTIWIMLISFLHFMQKVSSINHIKTIPFSAYNKALEDALAVLDKISMSIDVNNRKPHHYFSILTLTKTLYHQLTKQKDQLTMLLSRFYHFQDFV